MIMTMDNRNQMKEQIKALTDDLKVDKLLTKQKDEQLQRPIVRFLQLGIMLCKNSSLLTSTMMFCSASTSRALSYSGGT